VWHIFFASFQTEKIERSSKSRYFEYVRTIRTKLTASHTYPGKLNTRYPALISDNMSSSHCVTKFKCTLIREIAFFEEVFFEQKIRTKNSDKKFGEKIRTKNSNKKYRTKNSNKSQRVPRLACGTKRADKRKEITSLRMIDIVGALMPADTKYIYLCWNATFLLSDPPPQKNPEPKI
jgi:hypothetical protein